MLRWLCLLICLTQSLWGYEYDCIIVGSSPFSLFEARYQSKTGKKALVVEKDMVIGGAWRTIDILGVPNADLGCHWIHESLPVLDFLQQTVGCEMERVPVYFYEYKKEIPTILGSYLTYGCFGFIEKLKHLIDTTDVELRLGACVDRVVYNSAQDTISVEIDGQVFHTDHVVLTSFSNVCVQVDEQVYQSGKNSFFHLYFLIEDSSDPKFGYMVGCSTLSSVSRVMNMTRFVGLAGTGKQLIALQISRGQGVKQPEYYFNSLKEKGWIAKDAVFLESETFQYDQGNLPQIENIPSSRLTVLRSRVLSQMSNYVERWGEAF